MSVDLTRFHESFFTESLEGLDATEAQLLALERGVREARGGASPGNEEQLNAIFRGIHSIKGAAGSLGFKAIADFTHHVEGFLDRWRKATTAVDTAGLDTILACVDHARSLVKAAKDGQALPAEKSAELLSRLSSLGSAAGNRYRIHFQPGAEFFRRGNDPLKLLRLLADLGELKATVDVSAIPVSGAIDPEACYLSWRLELSTAAARAEIDEIFAWVRDDSRIEIEVEAPQEPPRSERRGPDRRQGDRRVGGRRGEDDAGAEPRTDRLHVSRDKIDELINLVGELVITKTMMKQMVQALDPASATRLEAGLGQLERNTRDLQASVMSIRMLPMSHAFGRFDRLVRDSAQRLGKQVRLEVSGEASELDKSVIEKLVDPLTHLVRNALDHGIEPAAERVARGKPETAVIRLHAEHKGGNIEIRVSDDGRGVDPERVAARAREVGLVGADEAVSVERACELIFEPGLSTAETVNELSGRGVGLDVVRKNILALSGGFAIDSQPGRGMTFVIRLPLTLAIIDGMLVTVGDESYIVPLAFIVECLQPEASRLKSIAGRGMLVEVRGRYLPLLELGRLTGSSGARPFAEGLLMILEAEGNQVALLVDALVAQEQVVIKSLESNYRKVPFIAGATILGEGRVTLILDVASLVRAARE